MGKKSKRPLHYDAEPSVTVPASEILQSFGVGPGEWDALVVGDGSGTGWNKSCGWACVLVDRVSYLRKTFHGGMNAGTSYLAELIPYVQALAWYADGPGKARLETKLGSHALAKVRVHVVTDCEIVARQGSGKASRRKGKPFWSMIEALEEEGFVTSWHWMARSKLGLNRLCDYLANLCRKSTDAVLTAKPPEGTTAYDYNPEEK